MQFSCLARRQFTPFVAPTVAGSKKNCFNVLTKTKPVSFTCDLRWFPGQSLRANFFLTRNAVDRSYRHCHLKSLVASQLVYILSPLRTNEKAIKEINKLFYTFLRNEKGDKIKRDIMINDYSNGGLTMIDIRSFNKSLKATWVKKYLDKENQGKWKLFFDKELQKYGGTLAFMSNLNKEDTTNLLDVSNCFISEILSIWSGVNFEDRITSENQFHDQCLWYNSLFRIKIRPVFYKDWLNKGIRKVKDLKDMFCFIGMFTSTTGSKLFIYSPVV